LKILLSAVGNRDPFAENKETGEKTNGPLMSAVLKLEPDIIILFPTQRQLNEKLSYTEDRCDEIETEIKKLLPKAAIKRMPLNLPDPTDHYEILKCLNTKIVEIKEHYQHSSPEYLLSISSGTSQIQASFLIMISSQRLNARVFQVRDPRFVDAGQEHIREVDVNFIEEENLINRAGIFFNKYQFASAADELLNLALITRHAERQALAELYSDLFRIYHFVDLYQHAVALDQMNKLLPKIQRFRKTRSLSMLWKQRDCLESIVRQGQREEFENLCDLYHNTYRRYKMDQYIDCLSRFKRIYEGCMFLVARNELGIPRPEAKLREQRISEQVYQYIDRRQEHIKLYQIPGLYEYLKGKRPIGEQLEQQLNGLSKERNLTINNHGMNTVSKEDAKKAIDLLKKLFTIVFPGNAIGDHPFADEQLKAVGQAVFEDLT
jgi:hypothetical protein